MLKEKQELLVDIEKAIDEVEQDQITFIKKASVFYPKKENASLIFDILDYANIILFEKAKENRNYQNTIYIVEDAKTKLKQNGNLDMTIDNMLLSIWEEIHEKYSRS